MSSDPEQFIGQPVAFDTKIFNDTVRMERVESPQEQEINKIYLGLAKEIFEESPDDKKGIFKDKEKLRAVIFKPYTENILQKEDQFRLLLKLVLEAISRQDIEKINLLVEITADFSGYKNNSDELKIHIAYFLSDNDKFTWAMIENFISSIDSGQLHDDVVTKIIIRLDGQRKDWTEQLTQSIRNTDLRQSMLKILKK